MMKRIMMITAVAAFALAAGCATQPAHAIDVTQWRPAVSGDRIDWDGTLQLWTDEARQAGDKCALQAYADYLSHRNSMGIWSSDAHSFSAIATTLGITRENLVTAFEESSEYRERVLFLEQQTLIAACLTNAFINQNELLCRLAFVPTTHYLINMTRDALQCGDHRAADELSGRQPLHSPTDWASERLPPALVACFGAEDITGAVGAMLGYKVLYFRQMAYLEAVRVRLGGHSVFDYTFNMTLVPKS
jgi:hypothetical protein